MIRAFIASFVLFFSVMAGTVAVTQPVAAAPSGCVTRPFLSFPAWYRGLTDDQCNVKSPADVGGLSNFIWRIVLNVIEIVLQLIAYVATIMIIVGGFRYLTSAGDAAGITAGKKTLTNAIIGLVISIASIAVVNLLFGIITGFKP